MTPSQAEAYFEKHQNSQSVITYMFNGQRIDNLTSISLASCLGELHRANVSQSILLRVWENGPNEEAVRKSPEDIALLQACFNARQAKE